MKLPTGCATRPELKLVDEETFFKAQALLDENDAACAACRQNDGTLKGSRGSDHRQPRHLLQGLIRCASCGGRFHTNGLKKRYMVCANYLNGSCTCRTRLPRGLAERVILVAVGERIFHSQFWFQLILNEAHRAWQKHQQVNPDEAKGIERALAEVDRKIKRLVDSVETGEADPEISERLRERRKEKADLQRRLVLLGETQERFPTPPDEAWLAGKLQHLWTVLAGGCPAAAEALRDLVGEVIVEEIERPCRKRKALRGRFSIRDATFVGTLDKNLANFDGEATAGHVVELDFYTPLVWELIADRVKELFDKGLTDAEISVQLQCPKHWMPKARKAWCADHNVDISTLRQRKGPHKKLTKPMRIADEAKALWDTGMPMQDIAKQLTRELKMLVHRDDTTRAIAHWHSSRGLPVPDGRARRKLLRTSADVKKSA